MKTRIVKAVEKLDGSEKGAGVNATGLSMPSRKSAPLHTLQV